MRDLAAISAHPSHAEFRNIEVVAIETRERLKVKLSLLAIPANAINAFQDICRDVIVFRERPDRDPAPAASAWQDVIARRLATIATNLGSVGTAYINSDDRLTAQDARRLERHMEFLLNAAMPLRRVEVKSE